MGCRLFWLESYMPLGLIGSPGAYLHCPWQHRCITTLPDENELISQRCDGPQPCSTQATHTGHDAASLAARRAGRRCSR
jgi:hypothetical protein